MANDAVLQVRMDVDLKRDAENLYRRMGTSLTEAVRIFARQSVEENGMPFVVRVPTTGGRRTLGITDGEFDIPDCINEDNGAIAEMFGADT